MINVGINARCLGRQTRTGVERYASNLFRSVTSASSSESDHLFPISFSFFGVDSLPESIPSGPGVTCTGDYPNTHSGLRAHAWEQTQLPWALAQHDLDLLHCPTGSVPLLTGVPRVVTIHDISPVIHPEWFSPRYAAFYKLLTPIAIHASERVITVSEFARDEIIRRYPSAAANTVVVYNGVVQPVESGAVPIDNVGSGEYLLFVGSNNPRKNLARLVRAFRIYRARVTNPVELVIVGPSNDIFAAEGIPDIDGVRTPGFLPEDQLGWLYHNAAAFVFPSLYEGFGLPILEAMSTGTPVVTSDRGAMAEVAGDAACLVNPEDSGDIAAGIQRVLDDEEFADALREAGRERAAEFTWERAGRETLTVYREVADET